MKLSLETHLDSDNNITNCFNSSCSSIKQPKQPENNVLNNSVNCVSKSSDNKSSDSLKRSSEQNVKSEQLVLTSVDYMKGSLDSNRGNYIFRMILLFLIKLELKTRQQK